MTTTEAPPAPTITESRWHRGLVGIAVASAIAIPVLIALALFDDRMLLGANLWLKPLKFAISTVFYAITLAWLLKNATSLRRVAGWAGWIIVAGLVIELVIIFGFAAISEASHFNVSTPLHTAAWAVMAASIVVVWLMTLLVGIVLFRNSHGDRARTVAIRAGVVLAIVGMALGFFMTSPSAQQLADFQGVAGAHAVGGPDGGAGLPILGWSTVAGDLRIPHFVGMHALQFFPLLVIALELGARRSRLLAQPRVRLALVRIAVATFSATLVVLLWQALSAQSIIAPSGPILVAGVAIAVLATAATATVFLRNRRVPLSGA